MMIRCHLRLDAGRRNDPRSASPPWEALARLLGPEVVPKKAADTVDAKDPG